MKLDDRVCDTILKTEYCKSFDHIRQNAMINSYYRYGSLKDNYKVHNTLNAVENIKLRLAKYLETGNTEFLADVANFAMIEFMYPQVPGATYTPTCSNACETYGMGVNEIKQFKEGIK